MFTKSTKQVQPQVNKLTLQTQTSETPTSTTTNNLPQKLLETLETQDLSSEKISEPTITQKNLLEALKNNSKATEAPDIINIEPVSDIPPVLAPKEEKTSDDFRSVQNIIQEIQSDYAPERQVQQYEDLLNKKTSLKERLARHQFSKEQAEKTLSELMKEAEQIFGTTNLEEIAQIVLKQAKQNQESLSLFEKELNQIETQLMQFETELAQLGE